jgi:hypothetical protein
VLVLFYINLLDRCFACVLHLHDALMPAVAAISKSKVVIVMSYSMWLNMVGFGLWEYTRVILGHVRIYQGAPNSTWIFLLDYDVSWNSFIVHLYKNLVYEVRLIIWYALFSNFQFYNSVCFRSWQRAYFIKDFLFVPELRLVQAWALLCCFAPSSLTPHCPYFHPLFRNVY